MPTWLRSLVNAFLSKVPGKISRLDTATRMMMDADFSLRREVPRETGPTVIRTPVNKRSLKYQNRCAVYSRPRSSVLHGKLPQGSPTAATIITTSIRPVTWCIRRPAVRSTRSAPRSAAMAASAFQSTIVGRARITVASLTGIEPCTDGGLSLPSDWYAPKVPPAERPS
jgi:hypothetical protein